MPRSKADHFFYAVVVLCQIGTDIDGSQHRLMDNGSVPDPVTQQYMALLARTEGLFTDPCYTGKIFHGFVDLVRSGKIPEGENAIFLHSGGTPAIWSKEHLDAAQEIFYDGEGLFVHKA